ncbi:KH domain-containing protein [Aureibacillus halotolerans]|uniref:RNA-binding protein KhpA n=1 Tax=Aureibacillus halotolerans TaxID=1508390 RepID=A0A4R6U7A2_9BACI|nr:KH domain-containing protein [Aureibacillus halotolerans]TDQ42398.1 hypothetical protein EV213_102432 [Aureibacillus halotolerans]
MTQLIESIVRPLVDHPDDVKVTHQQNERGDVYQLTVHPEDTGKVIGKHGRVAKAIRTIVYAAATESPQKIHLDIK